MYKTEHQNFNSISTEVPQVPFVNLTPEFGKKIWNALNGTQKILEDNVFKTIRLHVEISNDKSEKRP